MKWLSKAFVSLLFLAVVIAVADSAVLANDSKEGVSLFQRLVGGEWVVEGPSRHGNVSKTVSVFRPGLTEGSLVGESSVYVDGTLNSTSTALYVLHPLYDRWTYRSVNSSGFVQEAELLEMSENHFTFKGTACRPDNTQTTVVWKVTFLDDNSFKSESMAYHQGEWRDNPSGVSRRKAN